MPRMGMGISVKFKIIGKVGCARPRSKVLVLKKSKRTVSENSKISRFRSLSLMLCNAGGLFCAIAFNPSVKNLAWGRTVLIFNFAKLRKNVRFVCLLAKLGTRQFFSSATTTTRQPNRALGTRKNSKNI